MRKTEEIDDRQDILDRDEIINAFKDKRYSPAYVWVVERGEMYEGSQIVVILRAKPTDQLVTHLKGAEPSFGDWKLSHSTQKEKYWCSGCDFLRVSKMKVY